MGPTTAPGPALPARYRRQDRLRAPKRARRDNLRRPGRFSHRNHSIPRDLRCKFGHWRRTFPGDSNRSLRPRRYCSGNFRSRSTQRRRGGLLRFLAKSCPRPHAHRSAPAPPAGRKSPARHWVELASGDLRDRPGPPSTTAAQGVRSNGNPSCDAVYAPHQRWCHSHRCNPGRLAPWEIALADSFGSRPLASRTAPPSAWPLTAARPGFRCGADLSAGTRPTQAGPEPYHDAAQRGRPGRDPVGSARRAKYPGTALSLMRSATRTLAARTTAKCAKSFAPRTPTTPTRPSTGFAAWQGGGRASARETIGRVAAGAVADAALRARRHRGAGLGATGRRLASPRSTPTRSPATRSRPTPVRCPDGGRRRTHDSSASTRSAKPAIRSAAWSRCVARGSARPASASRSSTSSRPTSAKAMLSLPAAKGFEVGSGFAGAAMTRLSSTTTPSTARAGKVRTRTNHSGGIQGGISNGETDPVRVAFKPTATILREQETVNATAAPPPWPRGRHDPCVLPRAVPIVEAMIAVGARRPPSSAARPGWRELGVALHYGQPAG